MDATPPQRARTHRHATTVAILLTMADTTARVALPSLAGAGIGLWLDLHHPTKPWFTLAGLAVGFIGSALLVRNQIGGQR